MTRLHTLVPGLVILAGSSAVTLLSACNAVTGADDLALVDSASRGTKSSGTSAGTSASGGATTTDPGPDPGGAGGAGGASSGGGGSEPGPPAEQRVRAPGVTITEIAIYQGVKRPIMKGGAAASTSTPIVAGRDALVRVFTSTDGAYDGAPVTAVLDLGDGAPLTVTHALGGSSTDASLGSTVNFTVSGAAITPATSFRVALEQNAAPASDNPAASWPKDGAAPLGARSSGPTLKVKLVPIAYGADGSGRKPDTSAAQLARYEDRFRGIYPIPSVTIDVRAPYSWNQDVSADGYGWSELLDAIGQLRENDGAPADVYYFGIFAPASSMMSYCGGGCVAGLGNVGGPNDEWARAAIGLGFTGDDAAETAVHEIGHTHGRQHANCGGAQNVDASFPYAQGGIGTWGYDVVDKQLYAPNGTHDMMGYCTPAWVSDYTYEALFERLRYVNQAKDLIVPDALRDQTWDRARVGRGRVDPMAPLKLRTPPQGEATTVKLATRAGVVEVPAHYFPYDHLDGGVVMWAPQAPAGTLVEAHGVKVAPAR